MRYLNSRYTPHPDLYREPSGGAGTRRPSSVLRQRNLSRRQLVKALQRGRIQDLGEAGPRRPRLGKVDGTSGRTTRVQHLRKLKLSRLIAAPGHTFMRDHAAVSQLAERIRKSPRQAEHGKIVLNIVTKNPDKPSRAVSVDVWNGHLPLVAYMSAGYRKVGQVARVINPAKLEILVNGKTPQGQQWDHWIRASGADLTRLGSSYQDIPAGGQVQPGTIATWGGLSNHALGSRTTLGALKRTLKRGARPKVALFYGTLDPIHKGHMKPLMRALTERGFDEVLIVPGYQPAHKPNATPIYHRLAMIKAQIKDAPKVNLYTGNSALYLDRFGLDAFTRRAQQIYGTDRVHVIVGQDAYVNGLLPEGRIHSGMIQKYLVYGRGRDGSPPNIPDKVRDKVTFVPNQEPGYSSSAARQKAKAGQRTPQDLPELHPRVLKYINDNNLYR